MRAECLAYSGSGLLATVANELRYCVMSFIAGSSAGIDIGLRLRPRAKLLVMRPAATSIPHRPIDAVSLSAARDGTVQNRETIAGAKLMQMPACSSSETRVEPTNKVNASSESNVTAHSRVSGGRRDDPRDADASRFQRLDSALERAF